MKKNILPFVFATLFSAPAMSQGWRIAPTVGLNVSAISYSSVFRNSLNSSTSTTTTNTTTGSMIRFQIGALLDYAFSDRFSIRSGLLYTGKGGSLRIAVSQYGLTQSGRGTYQFNYMEIPLLLNIAVGQNGFRLVGGPVVGITLNAKSVIQGSNGTGLESRTFNYTVGSNTTDQILPFDLSASLGIVKELQIADRPLEVGLHVQPSFTSWNTISQIQPDRYAKNLLVGLRVAYFFELRR